MTPRNQHTKYKHTHIQIQTHTHTNTNTRAHTTKSPAEILSSEAWRETRKNMKLLRLHILHSLDSFLDRRPPREHVVLRHVVQESINPVCIFPSPLSPLSFCFSSSHFAFPHSSASQRGRSNCQADVQEQTDTHTPWFPLPSYAPPLPHQSDMYWNWSFRFPFQPLLRDKL